VIAGQTDGVRELQDPNQAVPGEEPQGGQPQEQPQPDQPPSN
jgi:hypothetical protein